MYSVLDDSEFRFTSCKNFGSIVAENALGAAGMISGCANNTTQKGRFYFYDCVNAGDITFKAGKKAGGISSLSAFQTAVYDKCRNYGRPLENKSGFCGIATKSAGATFKDCYGVSAERDSNGLLYDPIAPSDSSSNVVNCYYFGSTASEGEEIPNHVKSISVQDKSGNNIDSVVDNQDFLSNAYDGNRGTRWTFFKDSSTTVKSLKPKIIIKPESKSVNSLSIDWFWNGSTKRRYEYSLSCVSKGQETLYKKNCDFLAGDESQGDVSVQHAVQTLDNLQLKEVEEIILEVTDVRDVNGTTENSRQYLSIWEINLNVHSSAGDDDRLGTRLSITMNNSNGFSAIGAGVGISGLLYDPNGEGLNWSSYQRYKDIDYLLRPKELVSGIPLDMPEGVEMELTFDSSQGETVGKLEVSWRKPTPPEGLTNGVDTEVVLHVYNDKGEIVASDLPARYENSFTSGNSSEGETQSLVLTIQKDYINQGYKAMADVYHLPKESNPRYGRSLPYTWVPDFSLDVEESLPLPQFHLEIVKIENGYVTYDLVWDNAGEYEDGDTLTLGGITASTNRMQKTGEGAVQRLNNVTIGANPSAAVSAQVVREVEGKTVQSKKVAYQTQLLSGSYLEGDNKIALMTNSVFYGETPDTLYLESTLAGNCESFYRTDLMANDEELGIEVAVASTVARVPTMDVVKNVPMVLENLPQDSDGNSLVFTKVQAYPWRSQNDVVYYAWVVAENFTAEQVKESEYWDGSNMESGYFVEKVNDKYRIIYTACQRQIQEKLFNNLEKIPAPIITGCDYDSGNSKYTFTWETQSGAKYDVILNGYIQEGGEAVALYYGTMENIFSLTVSAENWRYPILELTVVRYGETNSKGELKNFGAKATKSFDVKLPLTTITAPIIQLANGKNELQYNISWGGLPEIELEALWEYQVWAQKGEGKIWLGSETREEKDGWKWKNQIEVDFDNIPQINGAEQTPKINGGDEVEIYVKAIAKEGSSYRDSADGLKVRFQVPTRMDTPDHDKMFLKWKDGENPETITRQEFEEEGFLFQVSGQEENNTCIFQAYLVGSQDEETSYSEVPEGAQPLYKEPVPMNGSSYLFTGIDSNYAGWHLLIRVRATSDNAISSLWSNYYSFKLPKVQADTPELEEETKNVNRECYFWNDGEDKEAAQELSMSVNHTAIKWEAVKHAETYEVELRKLHTGEGETDERAPYSFFIKKEDGVWKVIGDDLTSEGKWEETMGRQPVPGGDAGSYVYEFKHKYKEEDGSLLIEGYEEEMEAQSLEGDVLLNFSYKAALKLEVLEETSGTTEFRLILPDGEAKGYDFQRTQYVAVKAYPEDTQNYVNSKYCQWIRICLTGQEASAKTRIIDVQSTDHIQFWNETDGLDLERGWIIQNLIWDRPVTSQSSGETKGTVLEEELKEDQKQNAAQDDLLAYEGVEDVPLEMIPAENHGFTSGEEMSHELEDVVDMIPETPDPLSDGGGGQTEEAVDDVGQ
ncbi:MAG: hypothetical protein Q4D55_07980 [Eubacteriales bacterium]|nr:hypothetical protein [Eubacteriales bacterium]